MRRDREHAPHAAQARGARAHLSRRASAAGGVEGLFITTGIPGRPVKVMDDLIAVLELLRERHRFARLHPREDGARRRSRRRSSGSPRSRAACRSTSRRRAAQSLAQIAPEKSFATTLDESRAGARARRRRARGAGGWPAARPAASRRRRGHDDAVRRRRDARHRSHAARHDGRGSTPAAASHHAHFSAFRPIRETPNGRRAGRAGAARAPALPGGLAAARRTASRADEVVYERRGNLPLALDPKSAWALAHPERFPGRGAHGAATRSCCACRASARSRRGGSSTERPATSCSAALADLRELGVVTTRAGGLPDARRPAAADRALGRAARLLGAGGRSGGYHMTYEVSPGTFDSEHRDR